MDAARLGCAGRLNLADFGRGEGLAIGHEQQGQHDDRKHEIRNRTAGDDRGALAKPLAVEGHRPFGGAELGQPGDRQAGAGVGVAEHLDVAAERDRAEFPAGAGAVPPAEQFRAEADREDFDPDPVAARDQVMAELVNKDEDRQHQEKNADVVNPAVQKRCQIAHVPSVGSAKRATEAPWACLAIICAAVARATLSRS